ncbi:putative late blight resistance proteinR1A-10 [Sesamum angolense]|uniref:Late blight resistance proteinR1A-10 n=1 Tax=Sesamum angolense TaxID=2727404 RepID=A0AAE2BRF0_9LAMI|nr:putative late blight resistance proteinR1A-10 [Sesamum angolense]
MVTTRLANLAWKISGSRGLKVNFLDKSKSWDLFCNIVFGEEDNCPLELEEIGKTIAENCKGLPLSVIVIGGLLAKSEKTQDFWEYIAENLSSVVNLEDNERCLRILYMSYKELPVHLKPCFLYMGVFPKDNMTYVSRLKKLWVAEGFLKSISGKSLEEAAEEYLNNLIDRNLIVPLMTGSSGKIKLCSMHDILRDLCLREAQKEKFLSSLEIGQATTIHRRIVVHQISSKDKYDRHRVLHSAQLVRSLTCDFQEALPLASFRLLRVLKRTYSEDIFDLRRENGYLREAIFKLVNSRYLALGANSCFRHSFPSSMHFLGNLQTLIFRTTSYQIIDAPPEIWKMHQLRHLDVNVLRIPDPTTATGDEFVLPNLQKMSEIVNFKCCEAVVKRIPNIKKLRICYNDFYSLIYCLENLGHSDISSLHYCLKNLGRFQKLESLYFSLSSRVRRSDLMDSLSFSNSLKKFFEGLPSPVGRYNKKDRLRVLEITDIDDLEYWTVDNSHFPCLHHLCLRHLRKLKKIPWGFGEIQTLELIELAMCSDSAVISVKEIAEQQEELGNEDLLVIVHLEPDSELAPELKSLANLFLAVMRFGWPSRRQQLGVVVRGKTGNIVHLSIMLDQGVCTFQVAARELRVDSDERQHNTLRLSTILKEESETEMATAYAALVSLMHIIEQIQHHPRPPVSLDKAQVQSLQENAAVLQDFLELYSHRLRQEYEEDGLMFRIADAAHAAEDVIENHIVDQILDQSTSATGENISSTDHHFYQDLHKVIADMDLIKKDVIEIKEKTRIVQDPQLHRNSYPAGCRVIPIVGMGGIVSQEYHIREILLELVCQENKERKEALMAMSDEGLGEMLYKSLCGRRYLIVMDDMWSIDVWEKINMFFPNTNTESRIMITTRLSNLALQISGSRGLRMNFLEENISWDLFCETVFGEIGNCPLELEEIGKRIAKNCQGLPLSVIVIGGLLAKSEKTQLYWKHIAENLSSVVNLDDNARCLRILYLSYQELPIHLKPCFLYMGVFPEDSKTCVSRLRKLWAAEGFLKPISGKSLEEVAEEYLKDLIDRNLVIVRLLGSRGTVSLCSMHDLLRDLCLREAKNEKFLFSLELEQGTAIRRHNVVRQRSSKEEYDLTKVLHPAQLARSLSCDFQEALPLASFRLLRVLKQIYAEDLYYITTKSWYQIEDIFKLVNLRYLAFFAGTDLRFSFPSSIHNLWNLQTLIVTGLRSQTIDAPPEIWKMHQLRHVYIFTLRLPDPPTATGDEFALPNLLEMSIIKNFKWCEAVIKRIPNIKHLYIFYDDSSSLHYSLENLGYLHKLESLTCNFHCSVRRSYLVESLSLLHSLKKLTLWCCYLQWEDITRNIGSLPHLQVLKLRHGSTIGPTWETVEGLFCCLRFLEITYIDDMEQWTVAESSHFPRLNSLHLVKLHKLKKIPSSFGDIQTLELIKLEMCSDSVIISAKEIAEQQEEFGNSDFRVEVYVEPNSELKSLTNHNFRVFTR